MTCPTGARGCGPSASGPCAPPCPGAAWRSCPPISRAATGTSPQWSRRGPWSEAPTTRAPNSAGPWPDSEQVAGGVEVRPATAADLPGARGVAEAHGDVFEPGRPDNLTHELEQGRLVVAADGPRVVGFGGALERGGVAYLADLFLLPDRLGRGIGAGIMRALF